jgi:peptidoglycan/LPS O-acetylase OafA/YrhL
VTITHDQYLRNKYFASLDGLRCLSILMVIGFHCQLTCTHFFHTGQYGVSLFFVISGFLITTLLLREKMSAGEISLKNFYVRRTLRIFPLYYATLFIYIGLVIISSHGPERGAFFHNLPFFFTYTNNWFVDKDAGEHVTFAFAWSLATEEQFYLCWPSIVRSAKKWWTPLAIILGAATFDMVMELLTGQSFISAHLNLGGTGNRIVTSIATPICLGCALAYLLHMPRGFAFARPVLANRLTAPLALIALLIAYLFINEPLMIVFMVILVGAVCIRSDNGLSWILANPVARYIGTISYGLYLLHMIAMNGTKAVHKERDWIFFALALAISIAMASASYWMYEVPFLRLKNRFRKADQPKADDHAEISSCNNATPVAADPIRV